MKIEVIQDGSPIVTKAEIMKVKSGIYRLIFEAYNSRISLEGYTFGAPDSICFRVGGNYFHTQIEGLPNGEYLVLPEGWNNIFYIIDEHKFNDNNPKKAVWTNGA